MRPLPSFHSLLPKPPPRISTPYICTRCLSRSTLPSRPIPPPIPFVPDVNTFLTLIGRSLIKHASKIPSWNALFTLTSKQLEAAGLTEARTRRYLLRWREKFRKGEFGIGGDLKHVKDGVAELRIVEVPRLTKPALTSTPTSNNTEEAEADGREEGMQEPQTQPQTYASANLSPGMLKLIVNLPLGQETYMGDPKDLKRPADYKLHRGTEIKGPFFEPQKGSLSTVGVVRVHEGMWEHKRGRKIDGGERRRAEVRAKRRIEERKKARG
ncbi:MAG: hypothetical protein Q9227_008307 [Pyrenula ochraceoflavens]